MYLLSDQIEKATAQLESVFLQDLCGLYKLQSQILARGKLQRTLLYKKVARKMLMKLTPAA